MWLPDIGGLLRALFVALAVCAPLALWKAVDIVWWIATHVSVSVG
jgi:hypothetical protein